MELYDVMRSTSAVREFTDDPLPDDVLGRILDNARFAPTGGNRQGVRVIALAVRDMDPGKTCAIEDEAGMTLVGYLLFSDPLKPAIRETVAALRSNGISLKIISGDNRFVTGHVAEAIGWFYERAWVG